MEFYTHCFLVSHERLWFFIFFMSDEMIEEKKYGKHIRMSRVVGFTFALQNVHILFAFKNMLQLPGAISLSLFLYLYITLPLSMYAYGMHGTKVFLTLTRMLH